MKISNKYWSFSKNLLETDSPWILEHIRTNTSFEVTEEEMIDAYRCLVGWYEN